MWRICIDFFGTKVALPILYPNRLAAEWDVAEWKNKWGMFGNPFTYEDTTEGAVIPLRDLDNNLKTSQEKGDPT